MADLPSASVGLDDNAGAFAGGIGYLAVIACVALSADVTPRVFTSTAAIYAQHGYAQGIDYCAHHFEDTKQPILFVGLPIVTVGVLGRQNSSGVLGTSVVSIAAAASGYLEETDASIVVVNPGTIGISGITFNLSLDGGKTWKLIRLGTAASYTVPYVGIVINFGAGTLLAGDTYTFTTTAPMWDSAGLAAARAALQAQLKPVRSFMIIGDLPNDTFAGYVTTAVNAYETSAARFVYARAQVRDRLPLASKSKLPKAMAGAPNLTFTEVNDLADTITRSAGSWIADGFAVGDFVKVTGSVSNNGISGKIGVLTATVLTFVATDVANEGPVGGVTVVGSESLVFADAGAADTITRSVGSWLSDGFRVGDLVTITGTASNNVSAKPIAVLTPTVMTFDAATSLVAETIGSADVTIVKGETMSAWVSLMDSGFVGVDAQKRIDLGLGRLWKPSFITNWAFRRPVQWPASLREYQHDLQIPCWRKSDKPLDGWSMKDPATGNVVEYDERTVGGALAARFTCARTYSNGPDGAFIALSLTRATEGSLLSRTHNLAVANLGCTVVQLETENAIGQVLVLNDNGTGTDTSLAIIEERVNTALEGALLENKLNEGPRASSAVWRASRSDVLNIPAATLTGTMHLLLNGTLEKIKTTVRVQTAG